MLDKYCFIKLKLLRMPATVSILRRVHHQALLRVIFRVSKSSLIPLDNHSTVLPHWRHFFSQSVPIHIKGLAK